MVTLSWHYPIVSQGRGIQEVISGTKQNKWWRWYRAEYICTGKTGFPNRMILKVKPELTERVSQVPVCVKSI